MRQSKLFTKTRKEAPKDEVAKNADLLIRAGYIHKEMAGVYSYLPLGLRVFENIVAIIREEMNMIGGQEIAMTALQEKSLWEKTDRWDDNKVDVWFKTELKNGSKLGLGVTHEEPITRIMSEYVSSYRDLPFSAYQFQTKFRNETRAKSGIMRAREFVMKDLYSFCKDEREHQEFYAKVRQAYINIFNRTGIGAKTYVTFASGGMFSKFSEEFQTETESGEDLVYVDKKSGKAVNKEVLRDDILADLGIRREDLEEKKTIEVGNIFTLGTRFSEALGLKYVSQQGKPEHVFMGSYGIGPGRLMGTIVEVLADSQGIVWPKSVAPFLFHLVEIPSKEPKVREAAEKIYAGLSTHGEVLYDDRDARAGEKFADSDLIGIPYRVVVSEKHIMDGKLEIKERATGEVTMISVQDFMEGKFAEMKGK